MSNGRMWCCTFLALLLLAYSQRSTASACDPVGNRSYCIETEAVDDFSCQPGFGSNIDCLGEAANYYNGLVFSGSQFVGGSQWQNDLVYDTDFVDPNISGVAHGNDTNNFDQYGLFSSYYCGHGECNDVPSNSPSCTASSQCNNAPAGYANPGYCMPAGPPTNSPGVCAYVADKVWVVGNGRMVNGVCEENPPTNYYNGYIHPNWGGTQVRLGESSYSGSWANAGINGGVNFSVISNSCTTTPGTFWYEENPIMGGVQLLGFVAPSTNGSDEWAGTQRGTYAAEGYSVNENSSVGLDWIDGLNSIDPSNGPACPVGAGSNYPTDYTYGGGHGIGGCGVQAAFAVDSTEAAAEYDVNTSSWVVMTYDANDSEGGNWFWWNYTCNFDCNTYPVTL